MNHSWEEKFKKWKNPPSDTEDSKCENAERMIREAIQEYSGFKDKVIEVFAKGSYKNNTNVKLDSDVDVSVCYKSSFYSDFQFAQGFTKQDVGLIDSKYKFSEFKDEVILALKAKFGGPSVKRGNKSIKIHGNSYRIVADAVPAFEHRIYTHRDSKGGFQYTSGVKLIADDGSVVNNYPKQDYSKGVEKNLVTGKNYKFLVRILKKLRNEMQEKSISEAQNIASFLIESLVYNSPSDCFSHQYYYDDLSSILVYLYSKVKEDKTSKDMLEVNEIKYLFSSVQPWTRIQAHDFIVAAYNYVYGDDK